MRGSRLAVVAAIAAFAVPSAYSASTADTYFRTPSGNIRCGATNDGRGFVSCVVLSERMTGYYSHGNWHHAWGLDGGYVGVIDDFIHWKSHPLSTYRVLRYGRTLRMKNIKCVSRVVGLTCTSRVGHGYFLSRERQRAW